jgi:DNA-binding NtrC family response regulator
MNPRRLIPSRPGKGACAIAVFALLLVALVLIVGYQSLKATEEACFNEFNQRQLFIAREAISRIELYFESLAGAMRSLARVPWVQHMDEIRTRKALAGQFFELEPFGVNDIAVLDAKGVVRYNVAARHLEGRDFSSRRCYQEAKDLAYTDNTYIVDFTESKGGEVGEKGVLVAVPMFQTESHVNKTSPFGSGEFAGVVVCTLKLNAVTERFVVPIQSSGRRRHAFLTNNRYDLLWAPDQGLFGKNLMKEAEAFPSFQRMVEKMGAGDSGVGAFSYHEFDDSSGKFGKEKAENLIAYASAHLGRKVWALSVWAPMDDARRLIRSVYIKQLFMVGTIIVIILLASGYALAISSHHGSILERNVQERTKELRQSHERLFTVLNSLDAIVYVADMKTHEILFVNKYAQNIFGDVAGKICWQALQTGQSGPCDFCSNGKLVTSAGRPAGVNVWEFRNPATGRWFEIRDRAIHWVDGRIVRLEIATDIHDRKQAEQELKRAHREMGTFCRIVQQVGVQRTLGGVASFLMRELQSIVNSQYIELFVFSNDHSMLFLLSDREVSTLEDPELVRTATTIIEGLNGLTMAPKKPFKPPLLPEYFPANGRQTIIPLRIVGRVEGALVVACSSDCLCDEKALKTLDLVLEQASGAIKRAVLHEEEIRNLQNRGERISEYCGIIGKDPKMQMIYGLIEDIAPTDATVLIQGESGTGKELVARAIHGQSLRKAKPFVVINCSAYPSTLLESELFGHERGAFTGALRRKRGRFEQANSGTVFLDEIGEIAPSAQIKLLRVLQTRKFERLGGEQTVEADVRIVAASNKDLLQAVKDDQFREDLYYRLNVIPIVLPPLRKRRNDIPWLAKHFMGRFAEEQGKKIQGFTSEAMRVLLDYPWYGNVRELENSIEHTAVLAKGDRIEISDLPSTLRDAHFSFPLPDGSHRTILENEKTLLKETLEESDWNKKEAARRLGISRSTLYSKLRKYQITKPTVH